ncbi:Pr6Pr family membrane protein [Streptomyces sp. NBC_00582]|uniref:Pr6Pr family membrane protein n=1 Tax=Streptomyces sp. NBC_00582 TaxID=2975783 RepID=UPI002E80C6D0|nr:Pr6Pr family membrane protein [Streptomyces sp. NBC_00582]WUB62977.1 Pr6Pr family membrane protein [Streptomyces sp. NBC_00582]
MTAPIPRDIPDLPAIPRTHALLPSFVPASAVVPPVRRPLAAALRLLLAGTAAAGVILALMTTDDVLRTLSHFSLQSNALLAVVTLASAGRAWSARAPLSSALTGAALLYITITGLVYHLLLTDTAPPFSVTDPTTAPTGWAAVAQLLLHKVTPTAAALDWLLLTPPARLRLRLAATWMLYPAAYLLFFLLRAALITPGAPARYLYPFLDAETHGFRHALANALLLGLSFYALALLLVTLDRIRPNPIRHRAKTGFRLQPPVG